MHQAFGEARPGTLVRQKGPNQSMLRKAVVALSVALLLGSVALSLAACGGDAEPEDFPDVWTETGEKPHALRIEDPRDGVYRVYYDRFYPAYGEFEFKDGKLTYAPVSVEMVDEITYEADGDTITITSGNTGDSYTLIRARP